MQHARASSVAFVGALLAGCAGLSENARVAITSSGPAIDGYAAANLVVQELSNELLIAHRAFNFSIPARLGTDCLPDRQPGSVLETVTHERRMVEIRKAKLKLLSEFAEILKRIVDKKSSRTTNIERLNTVIKSFSESSYLGPFAQELGLGTASSLLALLAKWNEEITDTREILKFVRERRPRVVKLINDLISGVRPMADEATALLKSWDTCQYNRIELIRKMGTADPVLLDRAYTDHVRKVQEFEGRLINANQLRKLLEAAKESYEKLDHLSPEQVAAGFNSFLDNASKAAALVRDL